MKKSMFLFAMAVGFSSFAQAVDTTEIELNEVKIISSYATDRKTPVAVSTISARKQISARLMVVQPNFLKS
jgi:hypothetical protein